MPAIPAVFVILVCVALSVAIWLRGALKIAGPETRYVIMRMGRIAGAKGPGLVFVLQPIEVAVRVDLDEKLLSLDEETHTAQDNRTVRVNGLLSWKIVDPVKSVSQIQSVVYLVQERVDEKLSAFLSNLPSIHIASEAKNLECELASGLRKPFAEFGVDVMSCKVTSIEVL